MGRDDATSFLIIIQMVLPVPIDNNKPVLRLFHKRRRVRRQNERTEKTQTRNVSDVNRSAVLFTRIGFLSRVRFYSTLIVRGGFSKRDDRYDCSTTRVDQRRCQSDRRCRNDKS